MEPHCGEGEYEEFLKMVSMEAIFVRHYTYQFDINQSSFLVLTVDISVRILQSIWCHFPKVSIHLLQCCIESKSNVRTI